MADSREYRRQFWTRSVLFCAILVAILIVLSLVGESLSRFKRDFTADGIYTISEPFVEILEGLEDRVVITYYCSEDLPSVLLNLRRDTLDMFDEIRALSDRNVEYQVVVPKLEAERVAREKVERYREIEQNEKLSQTQRDERLDEIEPKAKDTIQDLLRGFSGRQKTPKDIREDRRKRASAIAEKTGRTFDDVRFELLADEYKKVFLDEMQDEGIFPLRYEEKQGSSVREVSFYSALEVRYRDRKPETIPVYHQLNNLELELAQRILKLTMKEKPVVAFFDGRAPDVPPPDPFNPQQQGPRSDYQALTSFLQRFFDVRTVKLNKDDSIEDLEKRLEEDAAKGGDGQKRGISCFIVAQPDNLEERQVYEISKAVSRGIPTILLVSRHSIDAAGGPNQGYPLQFLNPGLDDLMREYGLSLGRDVLASNECSSMIAILRIPGLNIPTRSPYPFYCTVLASASEKQVADDHALLNRIPSLVFPATNGLNIDQQQIEKNGLQVEKLAWTHPETWAVSVAPFSRGAFGRGAQPAALFGEHQEDLVYDSKNRRKNPGETTFVETKQLALLLSGSFPFLYQDREIPEWKPEEKEEDAPGGAPPVPIPGPGGSRGPAGPQEPAAEEETPATPPETPEAETPEASPPAPEVGPAPPPAEGTPGAAAAGADETPPAGGSAAEAPQPAAEDRKEEPAEEPRPKGSLTPSADGRLLVVASVDGMKDLFLQLGQEFPGQCQGFRSNLSFFQNAIETFGLGQQLLRIRSKTITQRFFEGDTPAKRILIQVINIGLVPLLVAAIGLARFLVRRADSMKYERQYTQNNQG